MMTRFSQICQNSMLSGYYIILYTSSKYQCWTQPKTQFFKVSKQSCLTTKNSTGDIIHFLSELYFPPFHQQILFTLFNFDSLSSPSIYLCPGGKGCLEIPILQPQVRELSSLGMPFQFINSINELSTQHQKKSLPFLNVKQEPPSSDQSCGPQPVLAGQPGYNIKRNEFMQCLYIFPQHYSQIFRYLRIPISIKYDNSISCLEIDTNTSSSYAIKKGQ